MCFPLLQHFASEGSNVTVATRGCQEVLNISVCGLGNEAVQHVAFHYHRYTLVQARFNSDMDELAADQSICCQVGEAVLECADAAVLDCLIQRVLEGPSSLLEDKAWDTLPPVKSCPHIRLLLTKDEHACQAYLVPATHWHPPHVTACPLEGFLRPVA